MATAAGATLWSVRALAAHQRWLSRLTPSYAADPARMLDPSFLPFSMGLGGPGCSRQNGGNTMGTVTTGVRFP